MPGHFFLLLLVVGSVVGHGVIWWPYPRSREPNNCGIIGDQYWIAEQWDIPGSKCGVCGDDGIHPRAIGQAGPLPNEHGGRFGDMGHFAIYRQTDGGVIVEFQANVYYTHEGFMEWRLCEDANLEQTVGQPCFNENLLEVVSVRANPNANLNYGIAFDPANPTRVNVTTDSREPSTAVWIYAYLRVPKHVTCERCVIQYNYRTGRKKYGCNGDPTPRAECSAQETFRGCSDVVILPKDAPIYQLQNNGTSNCIDQTNTTALQLTTCKSSVSTQRIRSNVAYNSSSSFIFFEDSGKVLSALNKSKGNGTAIIKDNASPLDNLSQLWKVYTPFQDQPGIFQIVNDNSALCLTAGSSGLIQTTCYNSTATGLPPPANQVWKLLRTNPTSTC